MTLLVQASESAVYAVMQRYATGVKVEPTEEYNGNHVSEGNALFCSQ